MFQDFVKYINGLSIGETFTRKDLRYILNWHNGSTIDVYRKGLCNIGFIEPTDVVGEYRKLKHVPDYINSTNYLDKNRIAHLEFKAKLEIL